MAETGESYMTARREVIKAPEAAHRDATPPETSIIEAMRQAIVPDTSWVSDAVRQAIVPHDVAELGRRPAQN